MLLPQMSKLWLPFQIERLRVFSLHPIFILESCKYIPVAWGNYKKHLESVNPGNTPPASKKASYISIKDSIMSFLLQGTLL